MAKAYDHLFKVILIGDSSTDKIGLMTRFCQPPPSSFVSTIGVDFMIKTIEIDSKKLKLQLWDTAGSERFRAITSSYLRGAKGIMLVYDITNRTTFESALGRFKRDIEDHRDQDAVVMLVGNTCHGDQLRKVSIQEGRKLAQECGYLFFEVDSETGVNVEPAFVTLAQAMKERLDH